MCSTINGADTEFIASVRKGDLKKIKSLLAKGTNPNSRDQDGKPALYLAVESRNLEVVQILLESKAQPNIKTVRVGMNCPSEDSLKMAPAKIASDMKDLCHMMNDSEFYDKTPLMRSVEFGHVQILQALISSGANVNAQNNFGETALMAAMRTKEGGPICTKILIKAGANVNATNNHGMTAIMFAAGYGHVETLKALLDAGASTKIEGKKGETAMKIAISQKQLEIIEILKNHDDRK